MSAGTLNNKNNTDLKYLSGTISFLETKIEILEKKEKEMKDKISELRGKLEKLKELWKGMVNKLSDL